MDELGMPAPLERLAVPADFGLVPRGAARLIYAIGYRFDVFRRNKYAAFWIEHLRDASDTRCDDRSAATHGLENDVGYAFAVTGQADEIGSIHPCV